MADGRPRSIAGESQSKLVPLVAAARETSAAILQQLGRLAQVEIGEASLADLESYPTTAHIMIGGDHLEVVFYLCFQAKHALAATRNRLDSQDCTMDLALDFMREYCNVTSGNLKTILAGVGIEMAHGLPFVITQGRIIDVITSSLPPTATVDIWGLNVLDIGEFVCCLRIDVKNSIVFDNLVKISEITVVVPGLGEPELF